MNRSGHIEQRRKELLNDLKCFDGSPLEAIGVKLKSLAQYTLDEHLHTALNHIEHTLKLLPVSFSKRFHFDTFLFQNISNQIDNEFAPLPRFFVPFYPNRSWGYSRVPMPSENQEYGHIVHVIELPGKDAIYDVRLDEYPWLIHEIAHAIYGLQESRFIETVDIDLVDLFSRLSLRGIADKGSAKASGVQTVDKMKEYWTPRRNQMDWSHEVAMDVTSLWLAGRSYVDCMFEMLLKDKPDMFQLSHSHPPYSARLLAMEMAADDLGWSGLAAELNRRRIDMEIAQDINSKPSGYASFVRKDILSFVVAGALKQCNAFRLPLFAPCIEESLERRIFQGEQIEPGIEWLAAAWIIRRKQGSEKLWQWEESIFKENGFD